MWLYRLVDSVFISQSPAIIVVSVCSTVILAVGIVVRDKSSLSLIVWILYYFSTFAQENREPSDKRVRQKRFLLILNKSCNQGLTASDHQNAVAFSSLCVSGSVFDTHSLVHLTKAHAYLGLIGANVFN